MIRRLAAVVLALAVSGPALADPVQVKVETGLVVGARTGAVDVYRNIPFAAPPMGPLRWAPPAPAPAWNGVRDATQNGPSCPQIMHADGSPNGGGANGPTSEDCLQLNVFAPAGAKKAPVMVWIHGGSHRTGAGWVYDGSNFARDGVVLVSINYRLGPLGYFAHPALAGEPGAKGNYGLMDQIAALQWVKRNIAAFGGDPARVTVFGESAGGMSTLAILAAPSTKGLYARAIVQSGGGWFPPSSLAAKAQAGAAATKAMGLPDDVTAAALRAVPADDLVNTLPGSDYGPFPDGTLLPLTASQAFASGAAADVPLIIGSNSGEDSLMGPKVADPAAALARIPAFVQAPYADQPDDETRLRAMFTDRYMGAPARWTAAQAASGQPAWLYHFSYVGSRFRPALTRAFHAAEIQYVFEYWGRRTPMSVVSDEDRAMATLMHSCWVAFAKTGVPTCASGPAWPAYDPKVDQLMEFGNGNGVRTHFQKPRLDIQEKVGLPTLGLPAR